MTPYEDSFAFKDLIGNSVGIIDQPEEPNEVEHLLPDSLHFNPLKQQSLDQNG